MYSWEDKSQQLLISKAHVALCAPSLMGHDLEYGWQRRAGDHVKYTGNDEGH